MHDPALSGHAVNESELIQQVKEGDPDAFRCLVEQYMKRAYTIAYSFVNDHHGAEEIAQDAFVRIHRSIGSFRGDAEFGTWLYRIVMNLSLNHLKSSRRKRNRDAGHLSGPAALVDTGPFPVEHDETAVHIERALHQLPTLQRATVILRHMDGLSTKQVSRILRCSEGTVKTHLYRGLMKLRRKLQYLKDEAL